jgi:hypothetical protein
MIRQMSDEIAHLRNLVEQGNTLLEESEARNRELKKNRKHSVEEVEGSARRHALLIRIIALLMIGVTFIAAFVLLDRKLPDRASRFYSQEAIEGNSRCYK